MKDLYRLLYSDTHLVSITNNLIHFMENKIHTNTQL